MTLIVDSQYLGFGAALSAAIFWSIAVIIFKSASEAISPFLITALKNTIAAICFICLFSFTAIPLWYNGFDKLDYFKILVSGILGMGLADVIFLYALSKIGANRIALINCFEPVVIYVLSFLFLNTVLSNQQFFGFIIVIIAILMIHYEKDVDDIDTNLKRQGIMLQITAVVLSSLGIVLIKPVLSKVSGKIDIQLWVTAFRLLPGVLVAWIIFLFQKNKIQLLQPLKQTIILKKIIISSGLGTFIALSFWIIGYANIKHPPIASILGQTSVIFIIILSWLFLKEKITSMRLIAMLFALMGVFLTVYN